MKATVMARVVRFGAPGGRRRPAPRVGGGTLDSTDTGRVASGGVRLASTRATTPAIAEHAAPMYSVRVRPTSSISTRPAASVPRIAPIVFAA